MVVALGRSNAASYNMVMIHWLRGEKTTNFWLRDTRQVALLLTCLLLKRGHVLNVLNEATCVCIDSHWWNQTLALRADRSWSLVLHCLIREVVLLLLGHWSKINTCTSSTIMGMKRSEQVLLSDRCCCWVLRSLSIIVKGIVDWGEEVTRLNKRGLGQTRRLMRVVLTVGVRVQR